METLTFQAICQVCSERIIWVEEDNLRQQWVHESTGEYRKDGHFAFVREQSLALVPLELVEPKPEGSKVAFW